MYHDRLMNPGHGAGLGHLRRRGAAGEPEDEAGTRRAGRPLHPDPQAQQRNLEPRVIGSIVQYLFAPDDPEAVIEKMAAVSTRIVSLTITEGGYNISDITGEFDAANSDVVRDLEQGAVPRQRSAWSPRR
jgi:mannitol 2-dehydrogenase